MQPRVIRVSSSISNWKSKLLKRLSPCVEWRIGNIFEPTIFFGIYHIGDFIRVFLHRGVRTIFWCGSDILQAQRSIWGRLLRLVPARHFCENEVELEVLKTLGIGADIQPMIFDTPRDKIRLGRAIIPQVYLCAHQGGEEEYGVNLVRSIAPLAPVVFHIYGIYGKNTKNIIYHGTVSSEQFDKEIEEYHAGLRLNTFDGFGEVLAKSVLLGQYPISAIPYQYIDSFKTKEELLDLLTDLRLKVEPNMVASQWWHWRLERSLQTILK